MVSLLAKFPWQATQHYTIATRDKIFEATVKMIGVLCREIRRNNNSNPGHQHGMYGSFSFGHGTPVLPRLNYGNQKALNNSLLLELLSAALNAAGFSERQRWEIYNAVGKDLEVHKAFLISPLAQHWPFEAMGRQRGIEEDVVKWYGELMASHPSVPTANLHGPADNPFGGLREMFGGMPEACTMDDVGSEEWNVMGKLVAEMCDPNTVAQTPSTEA